MWADSYVALYVMAPTEACRYLTHWLREWVHADRRTQFGRITVFTLLVAVLPVHVLDVCDVAWGKEEHSVDTIDRMYRVLICSQDSIDPASYDTALQRLLRRLSDAFTSDDPTVLSALYGIPYESILEAMPRSVVWAFADRLCAMVNPPPSHTHTNLLMRCIEEYNMLEPHVWTDWLLPRISTLGPLFSDDLIRNCLQAGVFDVDSYLFPMLETLVGVWLRRCDQRPTLAKVSRFSRVVAYLVTGSHPFDDPSEVPHVFVVLSLCSPMVLDGYVSTSVWTLFVRDIVGHQRMLPLTPSVAQRLARFADPTTVTLCAFLDAILTNPLTFMSKTTTPPADLQYLQMPSWMQSWLGYFTLIIAHMSFDVDRFGWNNIPDVCVQQILTSATANPDWWTKSSNPSDAMMWACVVIRLLAVFTRPSNQAICQTAAGAVARFMGTEVKPNQVTNQNWPAKVPIFPNPQHLERVLWLLDDAVLLRPNVISILVLSHTNAVRDRLCVVEPGAWTADAATSVVRYGAARTISAVAWTTWFGPNVMRPVQCAAIQTADGMLPIYAKRPSWVTLLRISARIPTRCAPKRRATTLERLISSNAGSLEVQQTVAEWVVHPTSQVYMELNRWFAAINGGHGTPMVTCSDPALFVLSRLRSYCAEFVVATHYTADDTIWRKLTDMINTGSLALVFVVLFFVVHYAPDHVLTTTASRFVCTLRCCLEAWVSNKDDDHQRTLNMLSQLERRCTFIQPRSEAVTLMCLGLHMTTPGDSAPEIICTIGDMRRLIASVGVGNTDALNFLFLRAIQCHRWQAWATLVSCETAAWKWLIREAPHGRVAAKDMFQHFPVMPTDNPQKHAWCETHAVVPYLLHAYA